MVTVVDHEPSLAAVNADIFAGDKTRFVGCQKQHHVGKPTRLCFSMAVRVKSSNVALSAISLT